jgi:hypothetical protein
MLNKGFFGYCIVDSDGRVQEFSTVEDLIRAADARCASGVLSFKCYGCFLKRVDGVVERLS